MFSFFHKKSYYMCDLLNHNLNFTSRNTLEPCCSANIGPAFVSDLSEKKSIKNFIKLKSNYIKMFKNGKIPETCKNCIEIKPYNKIEDTKISTIILNHYTDCECACIYCAQGHNRFDNIIKEGEKGSVIYDVLPFLNELYNYNLIDTDKLHFEIQGGNISCLKNYDEIISTVINRGVNKIVILTNNIVYLPIVEKLFKLKKGRIITSLMPVVQKHIKK